MLLIPLSRLIKNLFHALFSQVRAKLTADIKATQENDPSFVPGLAIVQVITQCKGFFRGGVGMGEGWRLSFEKTLTYKYQ